LRMEPIPEAVGVVARSIDLANEIHAAGGAIVGICCEFTPRELILAAGGVPVCLCGGSAKPIAEQDLPPTLCPLIKSTYGFAITGSCPFLEPADLIVAETTCDGKKKMYELLGRRIEQRIYVMELPQKPGEEAALAHWRAELGGLKSALERTLGSTVTHEGLATAIGAMNRERELLRRLHDFSRTDPAYVTGRELLHVRPMLGGVPEELERLEAAYRSLAERKARGEAPLPGSARILLTGVPMPAGMDKIIDIIEACGGDVVCQETCTGMKSIAADVSLEGDLMDNIAKRYLALPCSCMTPNTGRLELLDRLIAEFRPQGVIDLIWHGCLTYAVESALVREHIAERHGVPYMRLETDYSDSDTEQLRTRLDGFIGMLRG